MLVEGINELLETHLESLVAVRYRLLRYVVIKI